MNKMIVGILLAGNLFAVGSILAQPTGPDPSMSRQALEAEELKRIEDLKNIDPSEYQRQKASYDLQKKISQVIDAFRQNKIDISTAERQLYPLIKEQSKNELGAMDARIEKARRYLSDLQAIKKTPDLLIKKRVHRMLGTATPEEDTFGEILP